MAKISQIWWLWVPIAILVIQIIFELSIPAAKLSGMMSEWGPYETAQWLVAGAACFISGCLLFDRDVRKDKFLLFWVSCAFLGSLYITGEEISWGQWIFEWQTPAQWAMLNDQNETNLHNTSSWLDQKPRLLLEIGVIIGGIVIPLVNRFKPGKLPVRFALIYPPLIMLPTAALAEAVKLAEKIGKILGLHPFTRVSEVNELYMFYFVLLYLVILRQRLRAGVAEQKQG